MSRYATICLIALASAGLSPATADQMPKGAPITEPSAAKAFPFDAGVMDLLVTGAAARSLYDALPGKGEAQACGATGLHKGDGKISCSKNGDDHACHIWLDTKVQTLALPEIDDC